MSDINYGGVLEALNNKVDLADNTSQADTDFVIESYQSGTSGYRIYKSGWCEQWGKTTAGGDNVPIAFLKTMADLNFKISLTKTAPAGNSTAYGTCVNSYTTSGAVIGIYAGDGCYWEVEGYLATGD